MSTAIERTFQLPFGYRATFLWRPDRIDIQWEPSLPTIRKERPRRRFIAAYEAARRSFFEEVAAVIGGSIAIIDTDKTMQQIASTETICAPTRH
jgi:hypothetical protein